MAITITSGDQLDSVHGKNNFLLCFDFIVATVFNSGTIKYIKCDKNSFEGREK